MKLTAKTRVSELLAQHPHLQEFLAGYHPSFGILRNRLMRATMGRMATLELVAQLGDIPLDRLIADLEQAIAEPQRAGIAEPWPTPPGEAEVEALPPDQFRQVAARVKQLLRRLHEGEPLASLQDELYSSLGSVDPAQIPAIEQELIQEGVPVEEIQQLCDVHVELFRRALQGLPEPTAPPGHPVHTYMAENDVLQQVAGWLEDQLRQLGQAGVGPEELRAQRDELLHLLGELSQVERHYLRKENQLFPFLERHGVAGPSMVMWGIHDEVRSLLKQVRVAVEQDDLRSFKQRVPELLRMVLEMVYKEEKILFPLALEALDDEEWLEVRKGEDQIGYAFVQPGTEWPLHAQPELGAAPPPGQPQPIPPERVEARRPAGAAIEQEQLRLRTGSLTAEQLDLLLTHLPLDITFVDEHDTVRYYSDTPGRVFPRTPGIIGRKVQNCHPPKSLDVVNQIVAEFRSGRQDVAEFWIKHHGQYVYIRYFPLRDAQGSYRGTVEVTQEISGIQQLEGERRLLDWKPVT